MIKTNEVTTVDFRLEILQKLYSAVINKPTCCESACHLFFGKIVLTHSSVWIRECIHDSTSGLLECMFNVVNNF
jgi:hypothetical protein